MAAVAVACGRCEAIAIEPLASKSCAVAVAGGYAVLIEIGGNSCNSATTVRAEKGSAGPRSREMRRRVKEVEDHPRSQLLQRLFQY